MIIIKIYRACGAIKVLYPTCFTPFFNALPNLHNLLTPLLFSLTPFGWQRSIMLTLFPYFFWDYGLSFTSF